ncbi:unnamed protein product [Polarella glacialis]|uniref:50S ribosomal protein L10 n=1 Tax=Polarella glacialis TaxID=89957 RepID=A0A813K7C8_POLGL|nr:unnamed protein product [Polarella glacialis]
MSSHRMTLASQLFAACLGATCLADVTSFVLPSSLSTRLSAGRSAVATPSRGLEPLLPTATGFSQPARVASSPLPSVALGALLAGAALLRRSTRRLETARHVTKDQIWSLTAADLPNRWRPRISTSMARRNEVVKAIAEQLDKSFFVMVFNRDLLLGSEVEVARQMFPDTVLVRCLKNSLVQQAMKNTGWDSFSESLRGSNMYIFVENDKDLKETIIAYTKMEKKFMRKDKLAAQNEKLGSGLNFYAKPLLGAMLTDEWNVISPEDIPKLKDFPTKLELIAKIAGGIQMVTTKIAKGIKQVPTKLAIGTKKIQEKMEEDGKSTAGEVAV